ncbi:Alpha/Beta hydrolase protein [Russula compacta]|nr:Alpha/Beta hydrolase protein [Russula compacta]
MHGFDVCMDTGGYPPSIFGSQAEGSGLAPISSADKRERKLFFWFFPPGPEESLEVLIVVAHHTSLGGSLQENDPFAWALGQALPTQNEWSWTKLFSVLYVEQPVGTGFSQGTPTVKVYDVATQLVGFLQQFLRNFISLAKVQLVLTMKQNTGMYVPLSSLHLDLQGIWINDPVIGWDVVQTQILAVDFVVHKSEHVFAFNQTFLAHLDSMAVACNYLDYMKKHATYPPLVPHPLPGQSTEGDPGCNVWNEVVNAALLWPIPWDVLGLSEVASPDGFFPQTQVSPPYFDHGDGRLPPAFKVIPNIIEKNKRSVIVHGLWDFTLIAEGAGKQGSQYSIANDSFIVEGVGALGNMHSERGLTYVEVALAGHM